MNKWERWMVIFLVVYSVFYLFIGLTAFLSHEYLSSAIRAFYVLVAVWWIRDINHAVENREDVYQKWKAEYQHRHFVG